MGIIRYFKNLLAPKRNSKPTTLPVDQHEPTVQSEVHVEEPVLYLPQDVEHNLTVIPEGSEHMNLLIAIKKDTSVLWGKFVQLVHQVENVAAPVLTAEEQELMLLLKPIFGQVESSALTGLTMFVKGVAAGSTTAKTLAEWEVLIRTAATASGGTLMASIEALGSTALQTLIGAVLAQLGVALAALPVAA